MISHCFVLFFIVVLSCMPLTANDAERLFKCLYTISTCTLVKCLFVELFELRILCFCSSWSFVVHVVSPTLHPLSHGKVF